MCKKLWQLLFGKPDPVVPPVTPPVNAKKRALLFAINNYPGSQNDLNGCLNDQRDVANKLNTLYPGEFEIVKFADSQATTTAYKEALANAMAKLSPGATVIVMADSCFSGTITRFFNQNPHPTKNRFYQNPDLPRRSRVRVRFAKADAGAMRWITISGCGEEQTSADAFISGEYHGAFTFFALKALQKGMTYRQWHAEMRKYLPSNEYDQIPGIEGPDNLLDRVVFEGEVLLIHNSSHGTQTYDANGDEKDDYDEAICLINPSGTGIGIVTDDEINVLLNSKP